MLQDIDIFDIFERNRDKDFIIDALSEKVFTYAEFDRLALLISKRLKDFGVKNGSRVGVCLPNCAEFAALYFAALYSGFVIIPLNINFNFHELKYICKNSQAEVLVYSKITEPYIKNILNDFSPLKGICLLTHFD